MDLVKVLKLSVCFLLSACGAESKTKDSEEIVQEKILEIDKKFKTLPQLTVSELENLSTEDYQLIDVRNEAEIEISRIPSSITLTSFQKNPDKYKGKLLIPYCTIGYRSALITQSFIKSGYQAKNLKGSILSWAWKNKTFINDEGETNKVHVFGKDWNHLPKNYEAIY